MSILTNGYALRVRNSRSAQRIGRMARPQQHGVALSRRHQPHAAQDESAHEDLAQLGVGLDHVAQALFVDREDRAALANADAREPGDSAQRAHLSGELARRQNGHQLLAAHSGKLDLEASGEDHHETVVTLARLDQYLTGTRLDALTMRLEARDLRRRELGKSLMTTPFQNLVHHAALWCSRTG